MKLRVSGGSLLAVTGAVALLAGCGTSGSPGATAKPAALSATQEMRLAAQTARDANSFTGTSTIEMTAAAGKTTIAASFAERLRPSLLARVDVSSMRIPGLALPSGASLSGMSEILTPSALYLKWPFLSSQLHTGKPWIKIPLSALNSSSGINLSSLINQFGSDQPLTQTRMLAGATNVRRVGTGTVGGVPVTEYTGTVSLAKGLAALDPKTRATLSQALSKAGISSAHFTIWMDAQHLVRKSVVTESGSALSEVITTTVTSINQPVSVRVPPDSQVTAPPGGLG